MDTNDMSGDDFTKIIKMILVGMLIIAPLWIYLLLSGLGVFGDYYTDTTQYKIILYILVVITLIMLFIWQPFFFWRKLFNGSPTRDYLLKMGIKKNGIIKKTGKVSKYPIIIKKKRYYSIPVEIEVLDEVSSYTTKIKADIPEDKLGGIKPGIEVKLRIDKDDRNNLCIDWERF
jgi:hypothetical protein